MTGSYTIFIEGYEIVDRSENLTLAWKKRNTLSPTLTVCAVTTDISIKYFGRTVSKGLTVQLYWKVENASRIDITCIEKSLDGNFPLEGSIKVWPTETSTYILRAYGNNDELVTTCTKTIDVSCLLKGTGFYINSVPF